MDNLYINKKGPKNKGLIIGLAVGIAVAVIAIIILVVVLVGSGDDKDNTEKTPSPTATVAPTPTPTSAIPGANPELPISTDENGNPQWSPSDVSAEELNKYNTIETRFVPLPGYERISVEKGSYAEFIRTYKLKTFGSVAMEYDEDTGSYVENEKASTAGVFELPANLNRWMQCADSIIMLYAEYLYSQRLYSDISFTFSNGFKCDWLTYAQGNRFNAKTSKWELKAEPDDSYETFQKYIDLVYQYANTDSLRSDMSVTPGMKDINIGDAFVVGVRDLKAAAAAINPNIEIKYGHAIFVVDVAVNPTTGKTIFMLAEGNTPATEISIIENPNPEMGVWFEFNQVGSFIKSSESGIPWSAAWLRRFPATVKSEE